MLSNAVDIDWGKVELEPEAIDWYRGLAEVDQGRVEYNVELLAATGPLLGEPQTRQLKRKLRELRFTLSSGDWRISYYIATHRRIILLTAFPKKRGQERAQVARAERAMAGCIAAGHTAAEDEP